MEVGDRVKYELDNIIYLGTIVARAKDKSWYQVSVTALGTVVKVTSKEISVI